MAPRWYYQLLNEEFGPVSEAEIHDLVHIGTLADDDLVRREDSVKWCPLAEMHMAPVATASDGGPSELGDLSELSFSFGDSSALPEIADESNLPRMDEIQFEDESPRSTTRRRSRAIESPGAERDSEGWYYESLGNELGPMPLERLIDMADRGIITGADRVRNSANGIWIPFADVSALAAAWLNGNRHSSGSASSDAAASQARAERPTEVTLRAAPPAPRPHVVTRARGAADPVSRRNGKRADNRRVPRSKKRAAMTNEDFAAQLVSEATVTEVTPPLDTATASAAHAAGNGVHAASGNTPAAEVSTPTAPASPAAAPLASSLPQPKVAGRSVAPPKRPRRPSRSFSMPSFSMGHVRTKTTMAASIVLLLTIGFVTDTISLSVLGYTPSPASVLPRYSAEYRSMAGTAISGNDWREFGNRVRPVMLRIRRKIESNQSRTSDEERNLKATLTMLRLVNLRAGDKEKQAEAFAELQALLGGA